MDIRCRMIRTMALVGIMASAGLLAQSRGNGPDGEWRYYTGDLGSKRYSPLAQITADNVKSLRVVWRHSAVDLELKQAFPDVSPSNYLRSTPIAVDGVLYAPNATGFLEAFDAATGRSLWKQRPFAPTLGEIAGQSTRGVTYWQKGSDARLLLVRGSYLYALNPKTGELIRAFGDRGRTDLRRQTRENVPFFSWTGPIVVSDVVVIGGNGGGLSGGGYGDGGFVKESSPEDIRGYDVRTGKLLWTFRVVPGPGEFGNDSWGNESWKLAGNLGSWSPLSGDEELGYVYVPLTAPPVSYYGGWRPGDNLFSNSLVAIDVKTGKRVWHFQMVHHDLWEYDTVGPPILGDITVDGRRIKAVMQPSKTGFLYAFDRATGAPVWPIEERPVPQSTTPGEHTSPTQPFPTKPPPFERIGLTEDDLIDFTPELRKEALEIVKRFVLGSIFTPPSVRSEEPDGKLGTLTLPGWYGGGNWNTGAFDPDTGIYYAISHTIPNAYDLVPPAPNQRATLSYSIDTGRGGGRHTDVKGPQGLPLTKPPYGRITAIDMNRGEHAWMVANGDGPRDHPSLKDLNLPPLGIAGRPAPLLTKTLLFLGESSDALFGGNQANSSGRKFRAYDKATGKVLWETELPGGTTGAPMTYMANGVQYIVVPIGGKDYPAEWVAFAASGTPVSMTTKLTPATPWVPKRQLTDGSYTAEQAGRGASTYTNACGGCHGEDLNGGAYGVPLSGERFQSNLRGKPVRELYSRIITTMPPSNAGSLTERQVLDIVAHLLKGNGFPAGPTPLTEANQLNDLGLPTPRIVRFAPGGPPGVTWEQRGTSRTHYYYTSALNRRTAAGIWTSPDFSGQMHRATSTEFIYLLEGSITLLHKNGHEEVFKAGQALVIPRGTEFQWKKSADVKEYWAIFEREDGPGTLPATTGTPMFFSLSADGPAGKGLSGSGRTREHRYYAGADGSSVGVWETAPHTSSDFHKPTYTELMVFLSGNVTLTTRDGQEERFKAGDVALVPKGIEYEWSSDTARKYWVIFDKDPAKSN